MTNWHKQGAAGRDKSGGGESKERRKRQGKESKGAWWMPRLTEAKKDVVSCEKPRVGANGL